MGNLLDLIEAYCASIGCPEWLVNDISLVIVFLTTIGAIIGAGYKGVKKLILWRNQRLLNKDLHPFYTPADVERATRYYIPLKHQNVAPSIDAELGSSYLSVAKEEIIPIFLKRAFRFGKDSNKYYLILADTGMGKTTFLINLYLAYKNQFNHLFSAKKYDIRLLPLGYPEVLEEIKKIENKNDTILLLDAFDEDIAAVKDYQARLKAILDVVHQFREIVITCRTQFFPSEKEEPERTGYFSFGGQGEFKFQKSYLSVFDENDVKRYLRKRFSIFQYKKRERAFKIAQKSPTLVVRPMLLSHIEELVASDREYEFTFEVYEELIKKWIEREARKPKVVQLYGNEEKAKKSLLVFAEQLAKYMYDNRVENGGYFLPENHILKQEILDLLGIEDSDKDFLERIAKTKSLLNRDAVGNYKFSHKSVMEYFIARAFMTDADLLYGFDFTGMDATRVFARELTQNKLTEIIYLKSVFRQRGYLTGDHQSYKGTNVDSKHLSIDNASKFPIHMLSSMEDLKSVILSDTLSFKLLYSIYISRFIDIYWSLNDDGYSDVADKRLRTLKILVDKLMELNLNHVGSRLSTILSITSNSYASDSINNLYTHVSKDLYEQGNIGIGGNYSSNLKYFFYSLRKLELIRVSSEKDMSIEIKVDGVYHSISNAYKFEDQVLDKIDLIDIENVDFLVKEFSDIDKFIFKAKKLEEVMPTCDFIY